MIYSVFAVLACLSAARLYQWYQRNGVKRGGPISFPKASWLAICIFNYFLLGPFLLFNYPSEYGEILMCFFPAWMTIRAIIQLVFLYCLKIWRPWMGITHNLITIVGLWILLLFLPYRLPLVYWVFFVLNLSCLAVDSFFAFRFDQLIQRNTTGENGIWYASDDPKFNTINRFTMVACVYVYCLMAVTIQLSGR